MITRPRIGVDLGGTKIETIILAGDGTIAWRERVPSPRQDYDAIIGAVTESIARSRLAGGLDPRLPVGIGTPGSVSRRTGMMKNSNTTCLNGRPLAEDLANATAADVAIANDANCFTLSEASDGAGADVETVFGVILGTGVGGGICHNGHLIEGKNGITGEWGHNPIPLTALQPDDSTLEPPVAGRDCYCGRVDCVEQWLSGPAFARSFREHTGDDRSPVEIEQLARDGHEASRTIIGRYCNLLALALATVINIVDPDVVVLGGGMSKMTVIYETLPQYIGRYVFSDEVATPVVPARHGDSSGVRGAAWLWPPPD